MITSNVYHRVFQLRTKSGTASAFAVDHQGRQYLVTAKHVADECESPDSLWIYHEKQWKTLQSKLVGHGPGEVDISVFAPAIQVSPALRMDATSGGMIFGQDLFFLGFPFGLLAEVGTLNREFPLPLVKKGILSAILPVDGGGELLLLDGHNNYGFSGGPVVFTAPGSKPEYKVAAVVSGFRYHPEPIYAHATETPLRYHANTGIVIAYGISHAIKLIESNPIGVAVAESKRSDG